MRKQAVNRVAKKSAWFYYWLLALWGFCFVWFNPRLINLFLIEPNIFGRISVALFILFMNLFWIIGLYHLLVLFFSLIRKRVQLLSPTHLSPMPVAILYTTMNDFQSRSVESAINQDYAQCHLFILDDSTKKTFQSQIDHFISRFPDQITVVRRIDHEGFKAGNLNHALNRAAKNYDFFALMDADEILPTDFLSKLMPVFDLDHQIAFVQASHVANPSQRSRFARDLGLGVDVFWGTYLPYKKKYGFLPLIGHGAIIRRDVWEKIGGFPEVVAEDLAFATKARELGYYGYLAEDQFCLEDFPSDYQSFRRQQQKYVQGSCEFMFKVFPSFLQSKNIAWYEKLDMLISAAILLLPTIYFFFILTYAFLLPIFFGGTRMITMDFFTRRLSLWPAFVLTRQFTAIWTWDFHILALTTIFAPILCSLRARPRSLCRNLSSLALSAAPYLSLIVVAPISAIDYILRKRANFYVTGARQDKAQCMDEQEAQRTWSQKPAYADLKVLFLIELVLGIIMTFAALRMFNLGLLTFSLSLIIGPIMYKYGWDNRVVSRIRWLPFMFVLLVLSSLSFNIVAAQGATFLIFPIHF